MKINVLNQRRLKEILQVLFPEYKSISLKSYGMIEFRRTKWSRTAFRESLLGLCMHEIPSRLSMYLQYKLEVDRTYYTDSNFLVDYLYQLILRRESNRHISLINQKVELNKSINSILTDWRNSRLGNGVAARQTLNLFKDNKVKREKSRFPRLFTSSLIK